MTEQDLLYWFLYVLLLQTILTFFIFIFIKTYKTWIKFLLSIPHKIRKLF